MDGGARGVGFPCDSKGGTWPELASRGGDFQGERIGATLGWRKKKWGWTLGGIVTSRPSQGTLG